jgi:hypothetical protein
MDKYCYFCIISRGVLSSGLISHLSFYPPSLCDVTRSDLKFSRCFLKKTGRGPVVTDQGPEMFQTIRGDLTYSQGIIQVVWKWMDLSSGPSYNAEPVSVISGDNIPEALE